MSIWVWNQSLNSFHWLEQKLILKNFSLNCYTNSIDHFFYFNITSYIFLVFLSYSLILYCLMWCRDKKKNYTVFKKFKTIFWWEPWSFETLAYFPPFSKKFYNSPWHLYYKYRLSSWVRWHILEDRICIFVLFFLWILI